MKEKPLEHLHNNISKSSNLITNFISELSIQLKKFQSSNLLKNLPDYTILTFAKYENDFAVCFDYKEKNIYYVPKNNIVGNLPEVGEALKIYSPGKFFVDYTGITAEVEKIETYLNECKIAQK